VTGDGGPDGGALEIVLEREGRSVDGEGREGVKDGAGSGGEDIALLGRAIGLFIDSGLDSGIRGDGVDGTGLDLPGVGRENAFLSD